MKTKLFSTVLMLAGVCFLLGTTVPVVAEETGHEIVGTAKCNMCHKKDKYGNQAKIWQESKHAQAFATLASDAAKAIATEKGLGDPQQEAECLKCHVTEAFLGAALHAKTKYANDEGVGCEACHGPGSDYKTMKTMKDPALAAAAGLITPDAESCVVCHNESSPTYKAFDFAERWAQIAHPVPVKE